jgi:hypothetical protein
VVSKKKSDGARIVTNREDQLGSLRIQGLLMERTLKCNQKDNKDVVYVE